MYYNGVNLNKTVLYRRQHQAKTCVTSRRFWRTNFGHSSTTRDIRALAIYQFSQWQILLQRKGLFL